MFVNSNARKFLSSRYLAYNFQHIADLMLECLFESPYLDDIEHIIQCFDNTTKPRFRDTNAVQFVKFGSARDNDAAANIRSGQLRLQGWVIF